MTSVAEQPCRLALFAKHWTPGRVKTRLASGVGDRRAAEVYRQFVATLIGRWSQLGDSRTVWFTPPEAAAEFAQLAGDAWQTAAQCDGHLGQRLAHTFHQELVGPAARAVVLGTDSPNLPTRYVRQAFAALQQARLVLGPTSDGGYYLIGARGGVPPILGDMPFSTPRLWAATTGRLDQLGWQAGADYVVLPEWYDVDTPADLQRLRTDLAAPAAAAEPPLCSLRQFLATP